MREGCEHVIEYLKTTLPLSFSNLNPGISKIELDSIEFLIQNELPDDFKELYRNFNGQRGGYGGLALGMEFLSLERIEYFYKSWLQALNSPTLAFIEKQTSRYPDKIKAIYFHQGWIPVAYDGGGNFLAIDLAPEENGNKGQIISFGRDEDEKNLVYYSLSHMIDQIFSGVGKNYSVSEFRDNEGSIITEFTFKSTNGNSFLDTLKIN